MATSSSKSSALSETFSATALLVLTIACATLLLAVPRRLNALEMPSLTLSGDAVAKALDSDARAARSAPATPAAKALEAIVDHQGRSEVGGSEGAQSYFARRDDIVAKYKALVAESGEAAALRLRSKAAQHFEDALDLRLPLDRAKQVIGAMSTVLDREGVTRGGELVAPRFVARVMYKARWNILCGLEPAHAFERVELQAFYGWQALHDERFNAHKRIEALHAYGVAGGAHVEEALGVLLFRSADYAQSARAFEAAYARERSLRLRNYLLSARAAAEPAD
jgi:hypothetical protein